MTAGEQQHRIEEKNAAKTAHRTHKISLQRTVAQNQSEMVLSGRVAVTDEVCQITQELESKSEVTGFMES